MITPVDQPATNPSTPSGSLYRAVWRWHFYAGILVAPILIVLSVTGGLYVFKSEIETVRNADVLVVQPSENRISYEEQVRQAQASLPKGYTASGLEINPEPDRATVISFQAPKQPFQRLGVDPSTGQVLGELKPDTFFPWVLKLHRNLFLGSTGRVIVELTTCWTIVLLATGFYLWWPRRKKGALGVWLPRLRAKPYTLLRDLHTLSLIHI